MHGANFETSRERGRFDEESDPRERGNPELFGRGRHHRHRHPEGEFGGSRGPRGFGRPRHGRGRRARRGDIRQAILLLLDEEPRNGYGLMQEIEARSGGAWRPSPGSVYPALSQLEDEGLVVPAEAEGRKSFALTDEGRQQVEENRERMATLWDSAGRGGSNELGDLRNSTKALAIAARQVAETGSDQQLKSAREVVDEARRRLYGILADQPGDGSEQ